MVIATIMSSILYSSDRNARTAMKLTVTFTRRMIAHVLPIIGRTKETPRKLTMAPDLEN